MKSRDHAGVFVPPPLLYVTPLVVAATLHSSRPWPIADGNGMALTLAGVLILAMSIAIGLASVVSFRNANTTILPAGRPTTAIVERGPYRFTRNPMYLAMTIGYVGMALLLNSVWALLPLPLVWLVVDLFVIRREELYLGNKFGESYRNYTLRVRRWL